MRQAILLFMIAALAIATFGQKTGTKKTDTNSGSQLVMTIEHNGQKKEVSYLQFQTHDGNAVKEGPGKLVFFYGSSNNKDDKSFSFNGWINTPAKGSYTIGGENSSASFSVISTEFPEVPMFIAKTGSMDITAAPLTGGMVEGTFTADCETVTDEGKVETYHITGSFKLRRMA